MKPEGEKRKLNNRIYIMSRGKRLKPFFFFIHMLALFKNASRIRETLVIFIPNMRKAGLRYSCFLCLKKQAIISYLWGDLLEVGVPSRKTKNTKKTHKKTQKQILKYPETLRKKCLTLQTFCTALFVVMKRSCQVVLKSF